MEKEKKEIGKLIELLNEYEPYIASDGEHRDNLWYFIYKGGSAIFPKEVGMLQIISKKYGFIKWLVENDKIEFREDFYLEDQHGGGFGEDEDIIMLLAIQDKPIDFLISILK